MSTEQRDKAASAFFDTAVLAGCNKVEFAPLVTGFLAGWDAHAATMPDQKTVIAAIGNVAVASGDSETPEMPLGFALGDSLVADIADAVLALLNKEGED